MYYGNIYHPETGEWLAPVNDMKIIAPEGFTYLLVDEKIFAADGTDRGYLALFIGPTLATGAV
jgi:hypothetical protein